MSNMYGYSDYDGPKGVVSVPVWHGEDDEKEPCAVDAGGASGLRDDDADDDDSDMNPLQAGFWMEGDSMAPPCGTSVPTIHKILRLADVCCDDVVYDLGCGDGRVCLEAWHLYQCKTIGIEVEQDLVDRARLLISRISNSTSSRKNLPRVYQMDLRQALDCLVKQAKDGRAAQGDAITTSDGDTNLDLPLPTVIILYLLPEALSEIEPQLSDLLRSLPNCRIACNSWGLPSWNPVKAGEVKEESAAGVSNSVFVYTQQSLIHKDP